VTRDFAGSLHRALALSAQHLGWTPDVFWQATPAELHMALRDPTQTTAARISRSDLENLLERDQND